MNAQNLMTCERLHYMNCKGYLKYFSSLFFCILTACGGGSGGVGNVTQLQTLTMQESQRYFPLNDGNLWVSRETDSSNGFVTATFTRVSRRAGTKLVGGVVASVISASDVPVGSVYENYLVKDSSGVTTYGNNNPSDQLTNSLAPYRLVGFPIQIGSVFRQISRTNLDYGQDLDGDGINERIDITADVTVRGIETVTVAAGSFPNCLRFDTNVSETLTLSTTRARITATGEESDWFAQDIGSVKTVTSISGNGQSRQTNEELYGYMVDGRSAGLSLQVSPATASVSAGATAQFSVTLLDASNLPLTTVPAVWISDNAAVATVDATGLAYGIKAGTVTLTPSVGGVAGPAATLNVLLGFKPGANYPVPAATPSFFAGDTAIGDLNGDGCTDVVVMESNGSRILVYYQNANGTLDAPQVIPTTLSLTGIAISDINNDGLPELVVSGNSTIAPSGWVGRVAVYRQNQTTHALDTALYYVISTNTAGTLAIADLNSDGLPDIIVASAGSANGLLSFFFQGAAGTLGSENILTSVPVYSGGEVHIADMNSDGRNDIVVQSDAKQLAVIRQTAAGVYSTAPDFYIVQTSYWPFFKSFALGELNGDGRTDIAIADPGNYGYLNIFLQTAGGALENPLILNFGNETQDEIKIFDMNGDGLNDIIVLSSGNTVLVSLQPPTHIFTFPQSFYLPTQSYGGTSIHQAMSIGDVTGDGRPDVAASWFNEGIYVLPIR